MSTPVFKITPGIQPYAWGKKGSSSLAAQLADKCIPDFKVDEDNTYAEVSDSLFRHHCIHAYRIFTQKEY